MCSTIKLKRGLIADWWVISFFMIADFSFLEIVFVVVFIRRDSWWGHCPRFVFNQFFLHSSWYRLSSTLFVNFLFNSVFCVCLVFLLLFYFYFFLNLMLSLKLTWILTGHIHHSLVDTEDPTNWGCKKGKTYFITNICLWSVITNESINILNMTEN